MHHAIKNISKKTALLPGELIHVGKKHSDSFLLRSLSYHENIFREDQSSQSTEGFTAEENLVTWINLDGLHNTKIVAEIGERFKLHPLLLEDILNTTQRPKIEEFDEQLYVVFKMLTLEKGQKTIRTEQISLLIGRNFVLTFQETQGDLFDPIRDRIRQNKGRLRKMGADYLGYSLLDMTIDHYFEVVESLYEEIESLQQRVLNKPEKSVPNTILHLRQQSLLLRKIAWPTRQLAEQMLKSSSPLIQETTRIYLRDVVDHMIRITEAVGSLEDMLNNAMETYLTATNQKTNETMRVLTVVATIFMPLTFITSIYGMNFTHMPELKWTYGYAGVWAALVVTALGLLYYFRSKKWF